MDFEVGKRIVSESAPTDRGPRLGVIDGILPGILVADPADPEIAGRITAAEYVLDDTEEVERFLASLAR